MRNFGQATQKLRRKKFGAYKILVLCNVLERAADYRLFGNYGK